MSLNNLRRLQQDGYDIAVEGVHLLLRDVPFLTEAGEVARGTLISDLTTTGTTTAPPSDHTVYLVGGLPHSAGGAPLTEELICNPSRIQVGPELFADCQLSRKRLLNGVLTPPGDYYEKMTTYADYLEHWPEASIRRRPPASTARCAPLPMTTQCSSTLTRPRAGLRSAISPSG